MGGEGGERERDWAVWDREICFWNDTKRAGFSRARNRPSSRGPKRLPAAPPAFARAETKRRIKTQDQNTLLATTSKICID